MKFPISTLHHTLHTLQKARMANARSWNLSMTVMEYTVDKFAQRKLPAK